MGKNEVTEDFNIIIVRTGFSNSRPKERLNKLGTDQMVFISERLGLNEHNGIILTGPSLLEQHCAKIISEKTGYAIGHCGCKLKSEGKLDHPQIVKCLLSLLKKYNKDYKNVVLLVCDEIAVFLPDYFAKMLVGKGSNVKKIKKGCGVAFPNTHQEGDQIVGSSVLYYIDSPQAISF